MATTATKGIPYPLSSDNNNTAADIQALAQRMEVLLDSSLTTAQITALAGADLWTGRVVYDSTIQEIKVYRGATLGWTLIGGPIGTIVYQAAATAQPGYLYCDGTAYNTTTYARLFAVIGGVFGSNLPDLRNRMVAGLGTQTEFDVIGETGGVKTVTLATANLPSHTHTGPSHTHVGPNHAHTVSITSNEDSHIHGVTINPYSQWGAGNTLYEYAYPRALSGLAGNNTRWVVLDLGGNINTPQINPASVNTAQDTHSHGVSGNTGLGGATATDPSGTAATGPAGSGTAFSILNPYIVLKPYIKY